MMPLRTSRQLGVFKEDDTGEIDDNHKDESDDENDDGQPDTTKIARQVGQGCANNDFRSRLGGGSFPTLTVFT